jgi:hypothetical protein
MMGTSTDTLAGRIRWQSWAAIGCAVITLAALGCAPRAMRGGEGTDNPQMDDPALSTKLDREDINYLVKENLGPLYDSKFWASEIKTAATPPVFAIWPIENRTDQHLSDQMLTLLSSIETSLVQSGEVQVVAKSRQEELAKEIGIQQGAIFDPGSAQKLGRQIGAQYFVTGKLTSVDEKLGGTRRMQYSLFLQVIEIETGLLKSQNEVTRSKAIKR